MASTSRYALDTDWRTVTEGIAQSANRLPAAVLTWETVDLIDTRTNRRYTDAAHRIQCTWAATGVNKPASRTFKGERAHGEAKATFDHYLEGFSRVHVAWPITSVDPKQLRSRGLPTLPGFRMTIVSIKNTPGLWMVDPSDAAVIPAGNNGTADQMPRPTGFVSFYAAKLHRGDTFNESFRVFDLHEIESWARRRSTCEPVSQFEMRYLHLPSQTTVALEPPNQDQTVEAPVVRPGPDGSQASSLFDL